MYLTRIQLNPARRGSRTLLGSPQHMHAAVLSAYPHDDAARGRVLWRVDRDGPRTWLYVVGRHEPDLTHVVEQAGWPVAGEGWTTRPYRPLLDRLEDGQRWAFRLTANPTHTTRVHGRPGQTDAPAVELDGRGRPKSRRYGHVTVDQQLGWLHERTAGWGFDATAGGVVVSERETIRFAREGRNVTIARASFQGTLLVTEPSRLREVLVDGAGPAKAYGCGLLTLAPVP